MKKRVFDRRNTKSDDVLLDTTDNDKGNNKREKGLGKRSNEAGASVGCQEHLEEIGRMEQNGSVTAELNFDEGTYVCNNIIMIFLILGYILCGE